MSTPLTILSLIPALLRALDSAFAAWKDSPIIHSVLNAAANLIERGEDGAVELKALSDQITAMVAANRDPTPDEWAALKARSDAAHATLQAPDAQNPSSEPPAVPVGSGG